MENTNSSTVTQVGEERLRGEPWQPIETAPKDGTWILVCASDYECPMSAQWGLLSIDPRLPDQGYGWCGNGYIFEDVTQWIPMPGMQNSYSSASPIPGTQAVDNGKVCKNCKSDIPDGATYAIRLGEVLCFACWCGNMGFGKDRITFLEQKLAEREKALKQAIEVGGIELNPAEKWGKEYLDNERGAWNPDETPELAEALKEFALAEEANRTCQP
jgi:hypothetical protein